MYFNISYFYVIENYRAKQPTFEIVIRNKYDSNDAYVFKHLFDLSFFMKNRIQFMILVCTKYYMYYM